MKQICFFLLVIFISSCEKDKVADHKNNAFVAETKSGNNQKGFINQELDSTISIVVKDLNGRAYSRARISFSTNDGNMLQYEISSGIYGVRWLLGCNEGIQNGSIVIKDSLDRLIDTIKVSAAVTKDLIWNRACGIPLRIEYKLFIFPMIKKIAEHPNGSLFIIDYSGDLYGSADNGESWNKTYSFSNLLSHDISINENGSLFLSSDSGLYKSSDGLKWNRILNKPVPRCFVLDNNTLVTFMQRSDDEGKTWRNFSASYINRYGVLQYNEAIMQIKRIDNNQIVLLNDDGELLLSQDNGETWRIFTNTNTFWDISGFFVKDNNIYLVNIDGGDSNPRVYKSSLDNISWTLFCTLSHRPGNYYQVTDISSYGNYLYFLTDNSIFKVSQSGETSIISDFTGSFITSKNSNLVVCTNNGVFYRHISAL
jgi:hypothetical protein